MTSTATSRSRSTTAVSTTPRPALRGVADHYEAGPNLWHSNTVSSHGSFGYDFWGVPSDPGPQARRAHTGCGGTAFSRRSFAATRPNLPIVEKAYDTIPGCFYADLMATLLGRHSGCSYGDWIEVSSVYFSGRFDDDRNLYGVAPDLNATTVHGVKI